MSPDPRTCDAHFGLQRHPIEDVLPVTHLINASSQDLYTRLNEVEADLGLPTTDFASLQWIKDLGDRRDRFGGKLDVADAYTMRLTRRQARRGPWPTRNALLTPEARERIARLYAADIVSFTVTT
jgi:hypothetical protein